MADATVNNSATNSNVRITLATLAVKMDNLKEDVGEIKDTLTRLPCQDMRDRITRVEERSKRNSSILGAAFGVISSVIVWIVRGFVTR